MRQKFFALLLLLLLAFRPVSATAQEAEAHPLVWDAMEKTIELKPGDGAAEFEFAVTNTAKQPVEIIQLRPSCGCTTAEMPRSPWTLAPGEKGSFHATVDVRGKVGDVSKSILVSSTPGAQMLRMIVKIPGTPEAMREQNRQLASLDRQAVFRGECATCHVAPIAGKTGGELFQAACGICHLAHPRASMVPDLLTAREPRDAAWWRQWIDEGRQGSLMPAFAQNRGGPLAGEQVESLVGFALMNLPTQPPKTP